MNFKDYIFKSIALAAIICAASVTETVAQTSTNGDRPSIRITNPLDMQPRQYTILGVEVSGVEERAKAFVVATSGLDEGNRITIPGGEEVSDAIKRLYRTGLFSDVKISQTQRVGDGIYLHIQVQEQPRLEEFTLTGIRRSHRREIKEKLNLRTGFAVTDAAKAQATSTIKRYYEDKGYRFTEVEIAESLTDSIRNRVTVDFKIEPGERIQIQEIVFDGNTSFSDRKLRRQFDDIKQNFWWRLSRQTFSRDEFRDDLNVLSKFYRINGFRDIRILEDSVYVFDRGKGKKGIGIYVRLEEGPQYHIRNVNWDGNTVYEGETLTQALGFARGDVFNEERFQQNLYGPNRDDSDVYSLYHDIGYLFFQIEEDIRIVDGDSLDLNFFLIEDEIAKVMAVDFTGNTKTHDDVVRRTIRTLPGNNYSRSAIIRTIRELATLGYFVPENITPDLDYDYENKTVDITFFLDESQSTDNFEFSGGYGGRQMGLILAARVNFNNFSVQNMFDRSTWAPLPSGDGQRLSLGLQVTGSGYQTYHFNFVEPWFLGRPHSFGIGLSYNYFGGQQQSFFQQSSFGRQELFSADVSFGRRLSWPDDYFTSTSRLRYQYFNVRQFSDFITGETNVISFKETLERNSLDNFISPNVGSRITLSAELAPPLFNFDQFYKLQAKYQHHIPVVGKLVTSFGMEHGYMGWFVEENQNQYQRFVLGGTPMQQRQSFIWDNVDMRGYPGGFGGSITPLRNGQEVGGSVYSKYFVEVRYPVLSTEQIQLIPYLFAEGGNAFDGFDRYDPFNIKRAMGIGARMFMPILGLIDLSYGYRFDGIQNNNQVNAGEWQFLINFGAPF